MRQLPDDHASGRSTRRRQRIRLHGRKRAEDTTTEDEDAAPEDGPGRVVGRVRERASGCGSSRRHGEVHHARRCRAARGKTPQQADAATGRSRHRDFPAQRRRQLPRQQARLDGRDPCRRGRVVPTRRHVARNRRRRCCSVVARCRGRRRCCLVPPRRAHRVHQDGDDDHDKDGTHPERAAPTRNGPGAASGSVLARRA